MSLSCFHYAFALSESDHWPSLQKRQRIPSSCKSKHNAREGKLGLGLVEAMSVLLTGQVRVGREKSSLSIVYESNRGGSRVASSEPASGAGTPPPRAWRGIDAMKAPPILCVLEAMLLEKTAASSNAGGLQTDVLAETKARWAALLEELELATLEMAPYSREALVEASEDEQCRRAMMALTDAVYFALKRMEKKGLRLFGEDAPGEEFPELQAEGFECLFDREPEPKGGGHEALPSGYLARTLSALIGTGGTCLLVGPTGTFKTTTATRAADEAGAALEVVKGRPGIEDRDFFGGVVPTERGPQWVDGPVTKALRSGRSGPTMLLMDELLRFEPLFLGAFVGLLDAASPAELAARSVDPAPGCSGEPHYVAELPSGEAVACPTSRLTLVATTNMGSGYVQAGAELDAALMGRFELTVEVEKPDPGVKRMLYERAGGRRVADLLEAIEEFVEENLIDQGGLFARSAHPRLMLNMARHMERILAAEGLAEDEEIAAQEAAEMTVVPNCVQREASGLLDPAGRETLLQEVAGCAADIL